MNLQRLTKIGLVAMLAFAGVASGAEPLDQVRQTTDKILAVVQDPRLKGDANTTERDRRVRLLIDERFDWDTMARAAMGPHWRSLDEARKKEFVGLFNSLIKKNYLSEVEDYTGEKIAYKSANKDGKYSTVSMVLTTLRGTEVPVMYRLLQKGDDWFVYDVTIEGVSMVNNYRSQINSILSGGTYADLIRRLKARIAEPEPASAAARSAQPGVTNAPSSFKAGGEKL